MENKQSRYLKMINVIDNCYYHKDTQSIGECFICRNPICNECRGRFFFSKKHYMCKNCEKKWAIFSIIIGFLIFFPLMAGFEIPLSILLNPYLLLFGPVVALIWIIFYSVYLYTYNKWRKNVKYKESSTTVTDLGFCAFHSQRHAVNTCHRCKKRICYECITPKELCYECYMDDLIRISSIRRIISSQIGGFALFLLYFIPFLPIEIKFVQLAISSIGLAIIISGWGFIFNRLYITHLKNQWKKSIF